MLSSNSVIHFIKAVSAYLITNIQIQVTFYTLYDHFSFHLTVASSLVRTEQGLCLSDLQQDSRKFWEFTETKFHSAFIKSHRLVNP